MAAYNLLIVTLNNSGSAATDPDKNLLSPDRRGTVRFYRTQKIWPSPDAKAGYLLYCFSDKPARRLQSIRLLRDAALAARKVALLWQYWRLHKTVFLHHCSSR